MANATESNSHDLLMGAGKLYFQRFVENEYGTGDLHFMGNADNMSITTDVTTVTKKSSMDESRKTMASVNTGTDVTFSLVLTEYDATNLALGLYGKEGIVTQTGGTFTETFTIKKDMIISLHDPETKNPYFNIANVEVKGVAGTPATVVVTQDTSLGSDGTVTQDTTTFTGTTTKTYFVRVATAPTASGSLDGMELEVSEDVLGPYTPLADPTGTDETYALGEGAGIKFEVATGQNFVANEIYKLVATPSTADIVYKKDIDYIVNKQDAYAGMIRIPFNTTIAEDTEVEISFTVPEGAYPAISGGDAGEIEGYMRFIGAPNIGPCLSGEFWRCKIVPDGETSGFIGEEFGSYTLTGTVLDDALHHRDFPYYRTVKVAER